MKNFRNAILFLSFLLFSGGGLNYANYCVEPLRFKITRLTEQRMIELVAERHISRSYHDAEFLASNSISPRVTLPACFSTMKDLQLVRYASVDEFLAANPDCCHIGDIGEEQIPRRRIDRLLGRNAGFVTGRYLVTYANEAGETCSYVQPIWTAVSNCGDGIWSGIMWGDRIMRRGSSWR